MSEFMPVEQTSTLPAGDHYPLIENPIQPWPHYPSIFDPPFYIQPYYVLPWSTPTPSSGEKCPCCGGQWKRRKDDKAKDVKGANKPKTVKLRKKGK